MTATEEASLSSNTMIQADIFDNGNIQYTCRYISDNINFYLQLVYIQNYFTILAYGITMTFVRKTIPAAVTRQWKSSFLHIFRLLNWGSNCRINWSPKSTPPMVWLYLSTTEGMEISRPFPLVVWTNLQIDTFKFK